MTTTTTTTHWTDLEVLRVSDHYAASGEERRAALTELRAAGSIRDYVLGRLPGQDLEDPSAWGPADAEIDWTGFDPGEEILQGAR